MAWTDFDPIQISKRNVGVSASLRVTKSGQVRLMVGPNKTLFQALGARSDCVAQYGTDDDAGMVRVVAGSGPHKIVAGHRGDGRIFLPAPAGCEKSVVRSTPAVVVSQADGVLVFKLPDAVLAQPPKQVVPDHSDINVKQYLRTKGHVFKVLASGKMTLDGELKSGVDLLGIVNMHRRKADLPDVTYQQLSFEG